MCALLESQVFTSISSIILVSFIFCQSLLLLTMSDHNLTRLPSASFFLGFLLIGDVFIWMFVAFTEGKMHISPNASHVHPSENGTDSPEVPKNVHKTLKSIGLPILSEYAIFCMGEIAFQWFNYDFIVNPENKNGNTYSGNNNNDNIDSDVDKRRKTTVPWKKCGISAIVCLFLVVAILCIQYLFSSIKKIQNANWLAGTNIFLNLILSVLSICGCIYVGWLAKTDVEITSDLALSHLSSGGNYVFIFSWFGNVLYNTLRLGASFSVFVNGDQEDMTLAALRLTHHFINLLTIHAISVFLLVLDLIQVKHLTKYKRVTDIVICIAILSFCNWIIDTFLEAKFSVYTSLASQCYGERVWNMMVVLLLPLAILFRFHSALRFSELFEEMHSAHDDNNEN